MPTDTLPEHYQIEYATNWQHRVQQTQARLAGFVVEDSYMGERKRYDRIGASTSSERTSRHQPTNIQNQDMDSRWAYHKTYDVGKLVDRKDAAKLGSLVLPNSAMIQSHVNAYHRDYDDVAWKAALGAVLIGEAGTESYAFQASQQIAAGGTGLTLAKLIQVNEILEDADLEDGAPRVIVVTAKQITNLLNTTEVRSADYNTVKALASGQIDTFMGFKFIKNKRLTKVSSTRTCVCWVKGAVQVMKGAISHDVSIRKDLSLSTQIYSDWDLGATRIYDEGVVQIDCTES